MQPAAAEDDEEDDGFGDRPSKDPFAALPKGYVGIITIYVLAVIYVKSCWFAVRMSSVRF
jgi:hypothetical protein